MIAAPRSDNAMTDMAAVMARVRKMSDSQLADILAGKDVSVPQFAAMTEAMGRRQLRDAVKGAQAQQQAQQPSVKDQLLAEEAGLAALPAPNMESMDMAGGGIIAFENGGEVQRYQNTGMVQLDPSLYTFSPTSPVLPAYQEDPERKRVREILEEEERIRAARKKAVADVFSGKGSAGDVRSGKSAARAVEAPDFTEFDKATAAFEKERANAPVADTTASAAPADKTGIAALNAAPKSAIDVSAPTKFERRVNPFGQMSAEKIDFEGLKDRGFGEGLMKAGAGLLSAPGAKGFAAGIQALAESGAVSRKEIAGLKKDARDYEFNIAKAREAAEQGNDELALKYETLAEQAKYRSGLLGIQQQKLGIMKDQYDSIKIPQQLSNIYAKATDAVKAATAMRPVKPAEFQKMVDAEYRKRATAVGLGKAVDMYSPSAPAYNVVQSPKGAKSNIIDPFADEG